jgi:hypothetical protein
VAVLVGDEARKGREELRLLEGLHFREVEVTLWVPKSPQLYARAANFDTS